MKKILSLVAVMLVVALFVPTMAMAKSPVAPLPATVDVAGSSVPEGSVLRVAQASAGWVSFFQKFKEDNNIDGTMIAALDISLENATAGGSATIRVSCPGLYANGSVLVLHAVEDKAERIQASCYNGGFTFTVDSFSPFAFILQNAGSSSSSKTGSTPTSPQTGVYE